MSASDARQAAPAVLLEDCLLLEGVENILSYNPPWTLRVEDQWPGLPHLEASAKSGCEFCALMRESLLSASDDDDSDPWPHKDSHTVSITIAARTVDDHFNVPAAFRSFGGFELYMHERNTTWTRTVRFVASTDSNPRTLVLGEDPCDTANYDDLRTSPPFFSMPSDDVLSNRNIDFMKDAISVHQLRYDGPFQRPRGNAFLPTRLLDLEGEAGSVGRIRLVLTAELDRTSTADWDWRHQYATLSYCWGTPDVACLQSKTTLLNLQERLRSIDVSALSPVIKDAIQVCTKMSIRYLWIDALCVLQGDDQDEVALADWDNESQQMCRIFENALVTICAASSTSCQDRFLSRRKIKPALRIRYPSRSSDTNDPPRSSDTNDPPRSSDTNDPSKSSDTNDSFWTYDLTLYPENAITPLLPVGHGGWRSDLEKHSRWLNRGWVHQEISMSPRLLIFTEDVIIFSSAEFQACENGWQIVQGQDEPELGRVPDEPGRDYGTSFKYRVFQRFATDVTSITRKGFTKETDRLPAIAGLARRVADATGSEYLAGLFRDQIHWQLLFYKPLSDVRMPFEDRYRQIAEPNSTSRPSWSWAGIPGTSKYDSSLLSLYVLPYEAAYDFIDVGIMRRDETEFGRVREGFLKISVPIISLLDWVAEDKDLAKSLLSEQHDDIANFSGIRWDCDNGAAMMDLIHKVSVVQILDYKKSSPADHRHYGLFIYPAANDGEYYRIGFWWSGSPDRIEWKRRMTISLA